jgi:hypothetical protein
MTDAVSDSPDAETGSRGTASRKRNAATATRRPANAIRTVETSTSRAVATEKSALAIRFVHPLDRVLETGSWRHHPPLAKAG